MQSGTRTHWYFDRVLLNAKIQDLRFKSYDCVDEAVPTGYGGRGLATVYALVLESLPTKSIEIRETTKTAKCSCV